MQEKIRKHRPLSLIYVFPITIFLIIAGCARDSRVMQVDGTSIKRIEIDSVSDRGGIETIFFRDENNNFSRGGQWGSFRYLKHRSAEVSTSIDVKFRDDSFGYVLRIKNNDLGIYLERADLNGNGTWDMIDELRGDAVDKMIRTSDGWKMVFSQRVGPDGLLSPPIRNEGIGTYKFDAEKDLFLRLQDVR